MKHTSPTRLVGLSLGIELIWLAILMVCRVWVWAEKASSGFIQEPICPYKNSPQQMLALALSCLEPFLGIPSVTRSEPRGGLAAEPGFLAFVGFSEGAAQAGDINWSSPLSFAGRLITFFEELAGLVITAGMAESTHNQINLTQIKRLQDIQPMASQDHAPKHYNIIRLNMEMLNAKACRCYFFIASLHNSN